MTASELYSYAKVQSIEIDGKRDVITLRPVVQSNLFNSLGEGNHYAFQTTIDDKTFTFEAVVNSQGPNITLELGNDVAAAIVETLDQNEDNKISDREFKEGMENAVVSCDYDESLPWLNLDDDNGELFFNRHDEDSYRRVKLFGGDEDDVIVGEGGNDELFGDGGDDLLIGGEGRDLHEGGKGSDVFMYKNATHSGNGSKRDVITDFNGEEGDRIDFSNIQTAIKFIGSAEFSGSPGEVRFDAGILQLNTDKDQNSDMEIELTGVQSFSSDYLLLALH